MTFDEFIGKVKARALPGEWGAETKGALGTKAVMMTPEDDPALLFSAACFYGAMDPTEDYDAALGRIEEALA